jgi:hypothetical protein
MRRRQFHQLSSTAAQLWLPPFIWAHAASAPPRPGLTAAVVGTNLSGLEWARPGLRHSLSSMPNVHFTVPRRAEVSYLASQGFLRNRLPFSWEMLQPVLHDTRANSAARAVMGQPGAFHAGYASCITGVLDAHAAVGAKCILDLHNYARYRDFRWQADGSVRGLTLAPHPLLRPYTQDPDQTQERIFSLAPEASLTLAHFTDFWSRAAILWRAHPGLGGFGLIFARHHRPVAPNHRIAAPQGFAVA